MQFKFRFFQFAVTVSIIVEKPAKPKAVRHEIEIDFSEVAAEGGLLS